MPNLISFARAEINYWLNEVRPRYSPVALNRRHHTNASALVICVSFSLIPSFPEQVQAPMPPVSPCAISKPGQDMAAHQSTKPESPSVSPQAPNVYPATSVSESQSPQTKIARNTYSSSMPNARVVPNSHRSLRPMHACNTIMVMRDQTHEIVSDHLVFIVIHAVDTRYVESDAGQDALPSCLAVCTHDGVDGGEGVTDVEGRAAG